MTDDGFPTYYHTPRASVQCLRSRPRHHLRRPREETGPPENRRRRALVGNDPRDHDPLHRLHATRQDAGSRHRARDIGKAPWPEDRVPGQRYDTLGQVRKSRTGR